MASDNDNSDIPHADLLTFTDKIRGQFHKLIDTNSMSGASVYPRREYLTDVALERKRAADEAKRKTKGN